MSTYKELAGLVLVVWHDWDHVDHQNRWFPSWWVYRMGSTTFPADQGDHRCMQRTKYKACPKMFFRLKKGLKSCGKNPVINHPWPWFIPAIGSWLWLGDDKHGIVLPTFVSFKCSSPVKSSCTWLTFKNSTRCGESSIQSSIAAVSQFHLFRSNRMVDRALGALDHWPIDVLQT